MLDLQLVWIGASVHRFVDRLDNTLLQQFKEAVSIYACRNGYKRSKYERLIRNVLFSVLLQYFLYISLKDDMKYTYDRD